MSTTVRKKVTAQIVKDEHVDVDKKKQCLQTGIYDVTKRAPFLGSILQCLDMEYTHIVPRAGIMFDADGKKWKMAINPWWFCECLTDKNRAAVLLHEMYHITHKHPMRAPFLKINPSRRILMNIAMDMAINQYIPDLPKGCQQCPPMEDQFKGEECKNEKCPGSCIDVADYYDTKGNKQVPWDTHQPMEHYYHKLIERFTDANNDGNNGQQGDAQGDGDQGQGEGDMSGDGLPNEFDAHNWDSNAEENEMMDATEELVKRAMQKRGLSYDKLPQHVRELLEDIDARRNELNYRQLILAAIKRHASGFDREYSWTRRSRRFGMKSPGTKYGELPYMDNYIDTSGSISVQEANDFLDIIDNFLKVGARKCDMSMFHTKVYHEQKYKLGDRVVEDVWQSGGTNLEPVMRRIFEKQPDLAVILTDGCYDDVDVESWLNPGDQFPQCLFIISRDGYEKHPLTRLGDTVKVPNTDNYGEDKRLEEQ
jgi:predicted metal-dependent peptidase